MNFREEEIMLEKQKEQMEMPKEKILFHCSRCAKDVYEGDVYFEYQGEAVCEECMDDLLSTEKNLLKRIAGEEDE